MENEKKTQEVDAKNKIAVDDKHLAEMLCCGRPTAVRIGKEAGARMQIGKRVLYNVSAVERYLEQIREEE